MDLTVLYLFGIKIACCINKMEIQMEKFKRIIGIQILFILTTVSMIYAQFDFSIDVSSQHRCSTHGGNVRAPI